MKNGKLTAKSAVFIVIMLIFSLYMTFYCPSKLYQRFLLEDAKLSLETSRGRERKQQYEYNQVIMALPEAQDKLSILQPEADATKEYKESLKNRRKELRARKKELESLLENSEAGLKITEPGTFSEFSGQLDTEGNKPSASEESINE